MAARRERLIDESTSRQDELEPMAPVEGEIQASGETVASKAPSEDEPRVKLTVSLPLSLACLIDTVAGELRVQTCDLVAALLTAGLKGCRRPTVPTSLRGICRPRPKKKKSAA